MRTTVPSRVEITCDRCKAKVEPSAASRVIVEAPIIDTDGRTRFSVITGSSSIAKDLCPPCLDELSAVFNG